MRTYTKCDLSLQKKTNANKADEDRATWTGTNDAGVCPSKWDSRFEVSLVQAGESGDLGRYEVTANRKITLNKGDLVGVILNLSGPMSDEWILESLDQRAGDVVGKFSEAAYGKLRREKVEKKDFLTGIIRDRVREYRKLDGDKLAGKKTIAWLEREGYHKVKVYSEARVNTEVRDQIKADREKAKEAAKEAGKNRTILRVNSADAKQPTANK